MTDDVFIIGEAGSCHEELLTVALGLTAIASQAGCDAIKWQYWSSPERMRARRHIADIPGAYTAGAIHLDWFPLLKDAARYHGLQFFCSVYLPEDVATLSPYVDGFKIASFEALDRSLIYQVQAQRGTRPFYISSGMQTAEEAATLPRDAIRLHCVSSYPCPRDAANLGAIEPGQGYSDHTRYLMTGALAVAAGADVLEVHFRGFTTAPACPDYVVALAPGELGTYVQAARLARLMRGDGVKAPQTVEDDMHAYRVRA